MGFRRIVAAGAGAIVMLAAAVPARAEWVRATSKHFIVYVDGETDEVRRRAEELERFDSAFRYFQAVPVREGEESNKVTVYVVPSGVAVRRFYGAGGKNIGGFYQPRASGSVAFTPRRSSENNFGIDEPRIVLFHEYAHHLLLGNFAAAYPAWFAEGYAEFLSTMRFDKDVFWVGGAAQHRAYTLRLGTPLPAEQLFTADMRTMKVDQIAALYARGWLLTHYVMLDPVRKKQFGDYLAAFNAGKPSLDAARAAFGDLKTLDRDLNARMNASRLPAYRIPIERLANPVVTVDPLGAGEKAMIDLRMRSDRGVNREAAQPILAEATPIAARFPADPVVQGWFAEMALDAGKYDLAEAAADRALAIDPKSVQALIYKGQTHLRRAREARSKDPAVWKEARGWLLKANAIDPNDAYTLMLYYSSFGMASTVATANAKAALERAHELVPQDPALRFAYARQSLIDGKLDQARLALQPLAYSAHAGPDNAAAKLLLALDARQNAKAAIEALDAATKTGDDVGED